MQVSRFWTRVGTLAAAVMVQAASAGVVRHVYTGIECGLCCAPHCHLQQGDGGGEGGHGGGRGVGAGAGGGARVRHARGQRGAHRARAFTWVVRKHHPVYTAL